MITRVRAYNSLQKYIGRNLRPLAELHGITVIAKNGNINKGWKGLTLERLAGLTTNNHKAPNGLGFELKSVPHEKRNNIWCPRSTIAITMMANEELMADDFFRSHVWEKMKSILFCAVSYNACNDVDSVLLNVFSLDFLESDYSIKQVKADYDLIRRKCKRNGFGALTSRDGRFLQTRTKGPGHGSISRAFYAKREFLEMVCPPIEQYNASDRLSA